jgi:hypothetical protein
MNATVADYLTSKDALSDFAERFERAELGHEFNHAAHVAIGAWYVWAAGPGGAMEKMRSGLRALNVKHQVPNVVGRGYHETMTRFWIERIAEWIDESRPATQLEAVRGAVDRFGTRGGLWKEYWSYDIVKSAEAKASWIAPDLMPPTR